MNRTTQTALMDRLITEDAARHEPQGVAPCVSCDQPTPYFVCDPCFAYAERINAESRARRECPDCGEPKRIGDMLCERCEGELAG